MGDDLYKKKKFGWKKNNEKKKMYNLIQESIRPLSTSHGVNVTR